MKKQLITQDAPEALGPYSQGIEHGGLVFVSGQIPINPVSGELETDIEKATKLVLNSIKAVLAADGLNLNDVVKTTVFLADLNDFNQMNKVYETYFKPPYPARSTIEVSKLPKGSVVEIECIAKHTDN